MKRDHLTIAIILILAFTLRFYNILIGGYLFFREGTWGMSAWQIIDGNIPYRDFFHAQPPLSPYLLAIIFMIFGVGLIQARLFVIFFTSFMCIIIYLTGKQIEPKIGLFGSLIYAITPLAIIYGMFGVNDFVALSFCIIGYYFLMSTIKHEKLQVISSNEEKYALIFAGLFVGIGILVNLFIASFFRIYLIVSIVGGLCILVYYFYTSVIKQKNLQAVTFKEKSGNLIFAGLFVGFGVLIKTLFVSLFLAFSIVLVLEGLIAGIKIRDQCKNVLFWSIGFLMVILLIFAIFYWIDSEAFLDQVFRQHLDKDIQPIIVRIERVITFLAEENFVFLGIFLISIPFAAQTSYGRGLLIAICIHVGMVFFFIPKQYGNYYHVVIPLMAMVIGFFPLSAVKSVEFKKTKLFSLKTAKILFSIFLIAMIAVTNLSYPKPSDKMRTTVEWLQINTSPDEYVLTDNLNINFQAERRSPFAEISIDRTYLDLLDGEKLTEACYEFDIRYVVNTNRLFGDRDEFDEFLEFLEDFYKPINVGYTVYVRTSPLPLPVVESGSIVSVQVLINGEETKVADTGDEIEWEIKWEVLGDPPSAAYNILFQVIDPDQPDHIWAEEWDDKTGDGSRAQISINTTMPDQNLRFSVVMLNMTGQKLDESDPETIHNIAHPITEGRVESGSIVSVQVRINGEETKVADTGDIIELEIKWEILGDPQSATYYLLFQVIDPDQPDHVWAEGWDDKTGDERKAKKSLIITMPDQNLRFYIVMLDEMGQKLDETDPETIQHINHPTI